MTGRISSNRAIELVDRHRESIEGYVKRHQLDRYQINKLIKAETALRDRNSVLNFLRKERDKIERKEEREEALKEDVKNTVEKTGEGRINDLKDDIVDIREQMTSIMGEDGASFNQPAQERRTRIQRAEPEHKEETAAEPDSKSENDEETHKTDEKKDQERKTDESFEGTVIPDSIDRTDTGGSISADEKSRGKLQREVSTYFAGLPKDEDLDGIASSFKDLLPEQKQQELSGNAVNPARLFEELRGKSKREKAVKSAYAVKKAFERHEGSHVGYRKISNRVKDMEIVRKPIDTSEFFEYMASYDGMSQVDFDKVDTAVHDCKRIVEEFENG